MLKNLFIFIGRLFIPAPPTALEAMKASLRESEMQYLRTLDAQEYHACQAAMQAVAGQHDFRRCQRLEKFIQQEQRAQSEQDRKNSCSISDEEIEFLLRNTIGIFADIEQQEQTPTKKDTKQGLMPPEANAHKP